MQIQVRENSRLGDRRDKSHIQITKIPSRENGGEARMGEVKPVNEITVVKEEIAERSRSQEVGDQPERLQVNCERSHGE